MSPLRRTVERKLGPFVVLLSGLPKVVPFLLIAGLLVGGLAAQGVVGAALLGLLAVLMAVLLTLSWPALQTPARVLRLGVLALVVVRAALFLG